MKTAAALTMMLTAGCANAQLWEIPTDDRFDAVGGFGTTSRINSGNGNAYHCGGTLIAPNLVLTAKHCLDAVPPFSVGFRRLPDGSLASDFGDPRTFHNVGVVSIEESPLTDLALLTLAQDVLHIDPIPVHPSPIDIAVGTPLIAAAVGPRGPGSHRVVRTKDTELLLHEWNRATQPNGVILGRHVVFPTPGLGVVVGDSGGGVFLETENNASGEPGGPAGGQVAMLQDPVPATNTQLELVYVLGMASGSGAAAAMHQSINPDYPCWYEDNLYQPGPLDCPADLNNDQLVTGGDYSMFVFFTGPCDCGTPCDMADYNDDGVVDIADFNVWLGYFNANGNGPCPCPASGCHTGGPASDINGDGCVSGADTTAWIAANQHPGCTSCLDLNMDGVVDEFDLEVIVTDLGIGCP